MNHWQDIAILPETSLREVLMVIDQHSSQFALVVDQEGRLLGTITDGDLRRGLLRGVSLDQPVAEVYNRNPITVSDSETRVAILELMESRRVRQIPVLDSEGRVLRLVKHSDFLTPPPIDNEVVLMAGGLGKRLRPLTDNCPKPMLEMGGRPILETILDNFRGFGFRRFYFSVNYLADAIEEYFGDGSSFGVEIRYLREDTPMGTAGALSLLPERPDKTFIVMNADLLTKVNFQRLLAFHSDNKAAATMCVREYKVQIPFGVVKMEDHRIQRIDEKPTHTFFVNAGIYALDPAVLDHVPRNTPLDMPTLFERLSGQGLPSVAFPVFEYWLDIGHLTDFERGRGEFGIHFSSGNERG